MVKKANKQKSKTVSTYNGYKAGRVALYATTFLSPIVPATVVTAINWEEWFATTHSGLPFGFASLIVTVLIAVIGIMKSDVVFKKAEYALFFLALLFACIGISNLWLASLFSQTGYMWLYTASGLLGSGISMVVEKKSIEPNIEFYGKLVEDNLLDTKSRKKQEKIEQAKEEARREAETLKENRRRATTE